MLDYPLLTFLGTYYWYMYLLKDEVLTLTGLRKGMDRSEVNSVAPPAKEDVEASAGVVDSSGSARSH